MGIYSNEAPQYMYHLIPHEQCPKIDSVKLLFGDFVKVFKLAQRNRNSGMIQYLHWMKHNTCHKMRRV